MKMNAMLMLVVGLAAACTGTSDDQTGRTPAGDIVPANSVNPAASYALPAGARVVADAAGNRFLAVISGGDRAYALGTAVSCGCTGSCAPVAVAGAIGCTADAELRVSVYHYFQLQGAAAALSDDQIVAAPELTISPALAGTTRSCGVKGADFAPVVNRFADDLLQTTGGTPHTRVLLEYQGGTAVWTAPRGLFPAYDDANVYELEIDPEAGVTCTCNAGSGCVKSGGGLKPTYCDAGGCTSCTLAT